MSSGGQRGKKKRRGGKGRGQQQQQQQQQPDQSETTPEIGDETREPPSEINIDTGASSPSTSEINEDASVLVTTPSHENDRGGEQGTNETKGAVEYRKPSLEAAPPTRNRGKRAKKKAQLATQKPGAPPPTTLPQVLSKDTTESPIPKPAAPEPASPEPPSPKPAALAPATPKPAASKPATPEPAVCKPAVLPKQAPTAHDMVPTPQTSDKPMRPSAAQSDSDAGRKTPSTQENAKAPLPDHGGAKPKRVTLPPTSVPAGPQRGKLSEVSLKPIKRPDKGGTIGRRIKLHVNLFEIKLPDKFYHHYNTNIKLAGGKEWDKGFTKSERPKIIEGMVKLYKSECPNGPRLVYDQNGKNIFCAEPVPNIDRGREFEVLFTTDHGKDRKYVVEIKWVGQVDLRDLYEALKGARDEIPQSAIQVINTAIGHLPSIECVRHRSSFYDIPRPGARMPDLTGGVECWSGRFMSARGVKWKMVLNVDKCSAGFYKSQPVLQLMCDVLGFRDYRNVPRRLNPEQHRKFKRAIEGVKVEATHTKRKQKVNKLSDSSARNEMFTNERGEKISVAEYFKRTYNNALQYPELPCVRLGQRCLIPIELCNVLPQQRKTELTPEQTAAIIRHTAIPAPERRKQICQLVHGSNFNRDPNCVDFGIKVNDEMMGVEGRILPPPEITYGPGKNPVNVTPAAGKWDMQQKAYQPVDIKEWAVVSFTEQDIEYFFKELVYGAKLKGISMHASPCYFKWLRSVEEIKAEFGTIRKKYPNLQLLFAILPEPKDRNRKPVPVGSFYEAVKQYGDVEYGMITQCIAAATIEKKAKDKQTIGNICLKLNAKVGGITSIIAKGVKSDIFKKPVIIFGADVTHASLGKFSPSIAAVVASMDRHPNRYSPEVRLQPRGKEIIVEMKDIAKKLLQEFHGALNCWPQRIIFYRDGVDEGQFQKVLLSELQDIQQACKEINDNCQPAITYIVVRKRHHTLFFPKEEKDGEGKSKNIPAGTLVDGEVCHPSEFDWYLCSHTGIQGTSKSAHYNVLYDDSNFSSDQLQVLSHQLCHTYVKCARSVSIPAPIYYAHHVAFRARYHLKKVVVHPDGTIDMADGGITEEMKNAVKVHEAIESRLYFA